MTLTECNSFGPWFKILNMQDDLFDKIDRISLLGTLQNVAETYQLNIRLGH